MGDQHSNVSSSAILPFPNTKGLTGLQTMQLGEPSKCVEVPSAQYCVLAGALQPPNGQKEFGMALSLGSCLPKTCSEADLSNLLNSLPGNVSTKLGLKFTCGLVEAAGPAVGPSIQFQQMLGWGGVPVHYPSKQPVTTGFVLTTAFLGVCGLLLALGTTLHWHQESASKQLRPSAFALEAEQPLAGAADD